MLELRDHVKLSTRVEIERSTMSRMAISMGAVAALACASRIICLYDCGSEKGTAGGVNDLFRGSYLYARWGA